MIVVLLLHVVHGTAIAFLEAMAIVVDKLALHARMAVSVMIVGVLVAAGFEIPARGFDAVVKALSLRIAIFRWRLIPTAFLRTGVASRPETLPVLRKPSRRARPTQLRATTPKPKLQTMSSS